MTRFMRLPVSGLLLVLSVTPRALSANAVVADSRTNVILIMADDIGYECLGCYGSKQYRTPHIDRMARRGMRFTHCYSQPLCTPSRVKLMTGLSNVRNYSAFSVLNRDQRTIGQYFQKANYETAIAGKWQLLGAAQYKRRFRGKGTGPRAAGFEHACLWQVDQLGRRYWNPLLNIDGKDRQFGKDDYGPDIATKYLTDFIEAHRHKPFFVYDPMILVHNPFRPTPGSKSRTSRDMQRNFEDMVAYMDKLVGRIVRKTEQTGIADRTLILFIGDNGTHTVIHSKLNGRTIRGGKGKTTDAGMRVPFVAYQPGTVPAGKVCHDLVDFSDFLPTCLQAVGASIPTGLDGRSFLPQLHGKTGHPREWIYSYYCPRPERTKPVRFVRDRRWKLYGDGRFYNVTKDVLEQDDLSNDRLSPPAAMARKKLTQALSSMPAKGQTLLKFPK